MVPSWIRQPLRHMGTPQVRFRKIQMEIEIHLEIEMDRDTKIEIEGDRSR